MEPGPIPTLTASAPASINALAAFSVAILPATTSILENCFLISVRVFNTPSEWPCAVSTIIASTFKSINADTLSKVFSPTPTAAATNSLPCLSTAANGKFSFFKISFTVINPQSEPLLLTTNNFSIRYFCKTILASVRVVPCFTVTKFSLVIRSETRRSKFVSNLISLLVRIPINFPSSTTGTPEILNLAIISRASLIVLLEVIVTGSNIIPLSERLTRSTSMACFSMDIFLWITPIPPSRANAIANLLSVTVSIAELIRGIFNLILLVNCADKSTSLGRTVE